VNKGWWERVERVQVEHKEEADKLEHAALVDGLQKLRVDATAATAAVAEKAEAATAAVAEKARAAMAAVAEKAEAATQKLAVAAHEDVEKARRELAAAVQVMVIFRQGIHSDSVMRHWRTCTSD
jgi:hypothetical protein